MGRNLVSLCIVLNLRTDWSIKGKITALFAAAKKKKKKKVRKSSLRAPQSLLRGCSSGWFVAESVLAAVCEHS